MIINIQPG